MASEHNPAIRGITDMVNQRHSVATLKDLQAIVDGAFSLSNKARYQPTTGQGTHIAAPTFKKEAGDASAIMRGRRIVEENGHIKKVAFVMIDQPASQMNRMEELLVEKMRDGEIDVPTVIIDLTHEKGAQKASIQKIIGRADVYMEELPHSIADAAIRDSCVVEADGSKKIWPKSRYGILHKRAMPERATFLLETAPMSLVSGNWLSTGLSGGHGAKFPRLITAQMQAIRTNETAAGGGRFDKTFQMSGEGIRAYYRANGTESEPDYTLNESEALIENKKPVAFGKESKLSEINHGFIPPILGRRTIVSCEYVLREMEISVAQLRRYRFPEISSDTGFELAAGNTSKEARQARNRAGRVYLLALALLSNTLFHYRGGLLRSGCSLQPVENWSSGVPYLVRQTAPTEGFPEVITLTEAQAIRLYEEARAAAVAAGLSLSPEPLVLIPSDTMLDLVDRALGGGEEEGKKEAQKDKNPNGKGKKGKKTLPDKNEAEDTAAEIEDAAD